MPLAPATSEVVMQSDESEMQISQMAQSYPERSLMVEQSAPATSTFIRSLLSPGPSMSGDDVDGYDSHFDNAADVVNASLDAQFECIQDQGYPLHISLNHLSQRNAMYQLEMDKKNAHFMSEVSSFATQTASMFSIDQTEDIPYNE